MDKAIEVVRSHINQNSKIVWGYETPTEYVFCIIYGEYYQDNPANTFCSVDKNTGEYKDYFFSEYVAKYHDVNASNLKYIDVKEEDIKNARK